MRCGWKSDASGGYGYENGDHRSVTPPKAIETTRSEECNGAFVSALIRAAGGDVEQAMEAWDWFRNRASRKGGERAGWGGERVTVLQDDSERARAYRMIYDLRRHTTFTVDEIAELVHLSPDRTAHILCEANVRKAENIGG